MATLSSYLGGSSKSSPTGSRNTGYTYPKPYQPYSVQRRGVKGFESSAGQFGGQDLASALMQQRMVSSAVKPSSQFDSAYNYDPILQKIQALASQSVANATTNAAQSRKEALIASGQVPIGRELGFDANTLAAAEQNPESDWSQLQREFASRQNQLAETMSAQNLLYSGENVKAISDLAQGRASAEGAIGAKLRQMLSGIDTGLLGSQEKARQEALQAAQDAALAREYVASQGLGSGDMNDFMYGNSIPGYSDEQLYAAATAGLPSGKPMHIMQNGQVEVRNGVPGIYVKYIMNDGSGTNTIWIPLPAASTDSGSADQQPAGPAPATGTPMPIPPGGNTSRPFGSGAKMADLYTGLSGATTGHTGLQEGY